MKYTKPDVEIMELDSIDVIQTSGVPGEGGEGGSIGGPTEKPGTGTPIIPV